MVVELQLMGGSIIINECRVITDCDRIVTRHSIKPFKFHFKIILFTKKIKNLKLLIYIN